MEDRDLLVVFVDELKDFLNEFGVRYGGDGLDMSIIARVANGCCDE